MLIIGHRGAAGLEEENTIRSFKKAQSLGVDMIELDVRLSKDHQIMVIHDSNLKRRFGVNKAVADLTATELKQISAKREIPTLQEALENISVPLNIHAKVHGLESQLLKSLKNFSPRVLISCVYPGVLKKIRTLDGNVRLGLVIGPGELHLVPILNYLTRKIDLYSIHPSYSIVSRASIALIRGLSKRKIFVWTINTLKQFAKVSKLGVDGVFTNYPNRIKN